MEIKLCAEAHQAEKWPLQANIKENRKPPVHRITTVIIVTETTFEKLFIFLVSMTNRRRKKHSTLSLMVPSAATDMTRKQYCSWKGLV